jgi:hypothetical protein
MSDRRHPCHHQQQQQHARRSFEDKCRVLQNELRKKNDTIDTLKYEI